MNRFDVHFVLIECFSPVLSIFVEAETKEDATKWVEDNIVWWDAEEKQRPVKVVQVSQRYPA